MLSLFKPLHRGIIYYYQVMVIAEVVFGEADISEPKSLRSESVSVSIFLFFFIFAILFIFYFFTLEYCIGFAIHQHVSFRQAQAYTLFSKFNFIYLLILGLSCGMWDLAPWPGSNPGPLNWDHTVLATGMQAKVLQLCPALCNPMDCSLLGSSVHGILQARIVEWVAMPSSRGSSWLSDWTHISYVSCIGRPVLHH